MHAINSLTKQLLAKRAELSLERWNITTYIPWLPCDDAGVGRATERLFFTYPSMMFVILSAFTSAVSLSLRHRFDIVLTPLGVTNVRVPHNNDRICGYTSVEVMRDELSLSRAPRLC